MTTDEIKSEILKELESNPFGWLSVQMCIVEFGEETAKAIEELVKERKVTRKFKKSGSGIMFQIVERVRL